MLPLLAERGRPGPGRRIPMTESIHDRVQLPASVPKAKTNAVATSSSEVQNRANASCPNSGSYFCVEGSRKLLGPDPQPRTLFEEPAHHLLGACRPFLILQKG